MRFLDQYPAVQARVDQDAAALRETLDMLSMDLIDPKVRLVAREIAALIIMSASELSDAAAIGVTQWRCAMAILELTDPAGAAV